jgi:hypothetical protein
VAGVKHVADTGAVPVLFDRDDLHVDVLQAVSGGPHALPADGQTPWPIGAGLVGSYSPTGQRLAKMTPVRGDDEKYARERKRDTCDYRSGGGKLELRDLRRGKPDSREQDEQEADFRKASAGVMRQSEGVHVPHLSCPAPPVSRPGADAGHGRRYPARTDRHVRRQLMAGWCDDRTGPA